MRGRLGTFLVLVGLGALAAGVLLAVFAATQRRFLYFPAREDLARASEAARREGFSAWSAGGSFLGWRAPSPAAPARAALLVLHGNAGSALDRRYFRDVFQAAGAVDVILLEYPGYGPRSGKPSEKTLVAACTEAVDLLRRERLPVALVGESLGSAVASLAAATRPADVESVLLVTPLASVTAVAKRHYPFLPSAIIADPYRADLALPRYPGRVGFLVAERDEVVFADLGLALFESHAGPKRLWLEPRARHNDVVYDPRHPRWREILHFLVPDAAP